jgi:uncharacterized membrane protein YccC
MSPTVHRRWETALRDPEPSLALRDEVLRRLTRQHAFREQVRADLLDFAATLREGGRLTDVECVLNVLDLVDGWCNPQMDLRQIGRSEEE